MKKILLSALTLLLPGIIAFSQTTATDFTATDCSSVSHTLFTELNAGKVVVLVWVMPCGSCISDAKAGYDAAQSFATSNPGKVLYWLSDDVGNTTCPTLSAWANTNSIGPANLIVFGNANDTINEAGYGGTGMPHVVVIGGTNHHIFYNQKNGSNDGTAITNAITQALATVGVSRVANSNNELKLFPNPAKNKITINYFLEQAAAVSVEIYNVIGVKVKATIPLKQFPGQNSIVVNFENKLPNGIYMLRLNTESASQTIKFTIAD